MIHTNTHTSIYFTSHVYHSILYFNQSFQIKKRQRERKRGKKKNSLDLIFISLEIGVHFNCKHMYHPYTKINFVFVYMYINMRIFVCLFTLCVHTGIYEIWRNKTILFYVRAHTHSTHIQHFNVFSSHQTSII